MNGGKKPSRKRDPERLQKFFSYMQYSFRDPIETLASSDLRKIRRIAAGEIADIGRGDRVKAFRVMADLGGRQDCEILSAVVDDKGEEKTVRAAAAVNMGLFPPKIAEKELIGRLKIRDDLIRTKVIKSLGMTGGPEAFRALSRLGKAKTDFVEKQLIFAKTLIAYRHKLDADPMPFIEGVERRPRPPGELLKLTVKRVRARKVGAAMKRFEGSDYGIKLAQSTGFEVSAGKAKWMLFLNKQPADDGLIRSINSRRMIMGILSRWIEEGETYQPQYVVLTRPAKDKEVQIMVVRSDGEMFYSGKAGVKRNILSFVVSDIKRAGTAPTKVRGKLTLRGIELEVSIPVSTRKGKRAPRTLKPDDFERKFSHTLS